MLSGVSQLGFFGQLEIGEWVAYLFAGGGLAYGGAQKRLRRRDNERFGKQIGDLERTIDPGRTSSSITPRGETRKEDR